MDRIEHKTQYEDKQNNNTTHKKHVILYEKLLYYIHCILIKEYIYCR